jgi:Leucine-rich repeat (LRR) protein
MATKGSGPENLKPLPLFEDEPVRGLAEDRLTLLPFADIVAGAAIGTRGPFTIGVFAEWGQGKTSVLRLAKERVDNSERKDNTVTVFFNAWQYDREEHPIVPLVATILQAIEEKQREWELTKASGGEVLRKTFGEKWKATTRALRSVLYGFSAKAKVGVPGFGEVEASFIAKEMVDRSEELKRGESDDPLVLRTLYFSAFQMLEKAALTAPAADAKDAARIVVFVDDLDRCLPDRAVRLLESIKLVLCQPGFIFVLAVARRVVESHLRKRYRDEFGVADYEVEGARYLDKMVQLPLPIPSHKQRFGGFAEKLVESHQGLDKDLKEALSGIAPLLGIGSRHTPRSLVRLLNNLLVDDRLKVAFEASGEKTFGIERVVFIGLCAVARSLRDVLDDDMYGRLSRDQDVCGALGEGRGLAGLGRVMEPDNPGDAAGGRKWPGQHEKVKQLADLLRRFEYLDDLFKSEQGTEWLSDGKRRQAIDEFFAEQRKETPTEEGKSDQKQRVEDAIRRSLGLAKGAPIADRLKDVSSLTMNDDEVTDAALEHLKALTNLSWLSLDGTQVSDKGLEHLKALTNLSWLSLDGTQVTDKGLEHLKALTNLSWLSLDGTQVSDKGLEHLKALTNLSTLDLAGTQVSDKGLEHLKALTNLSTLDLAGTQVSDEGLEHLKALTNLSTLSLNGTQVSDKGLEHLKALTNLSTLSLGGTQVSDKGLEHLKALTNLSELFLNGTQVSDKGLEHLKALTNLSWLSLGGTQVSDEGLEHLKALTNLSRLFLNGTQVSESGEEQLKSALPQLRIYH